LLSCVSKVCTHVLNARLNKFLDENNILNENQAIFRKHHSTIDHIFTVHFIIEIPVTTKSKYSVHILISVKPLTQSGG